MPEAISNTSPLLYLHQIGVLLWLPELFDRIWVPGAVVHELNEGSRKGCNVPDLKICGWAQFVEPRAMPSEWLALDLGPGELAAMALALENPEHIVLLVHMGFDPARHSQRLWHQRSGASLWHHAAGAPG